MTISTTGTLRLAVLVASFNRVAVTLRGLGSLSRALDAVDDLDWTCFLLDDASPDGTADEVRHAFPDVRIVEGNGSLFWNGGMRAAHGAARAAGGFDAYLMFNDDVDVAAAAVPGFFEAFRRANAEQPTILAGMTADAAGGITYGGIRLRSRLLPLRVERMAPQPGAAPCDTFHGNFVLVPADALDRLGFDPAYVHQYGDIDLGLSANRIGVRTMVWQDPIGRCDANAGATMPKGPLAKRLRLGLTGRNNFAQHAHFIRKHSSSRLLAEPIVAISFVKRVLTLVRG